MCFSAEVSFGASVVISSVGALALAKSTNKQHRLFAMVPFLFGIQQFFEGWVWMWLEHSSSPFMGNVSMYGFLIFAQLIWPVWIPLSTYYLEPNKLRRKIILFFLSVGVFLFMILGYRLIVCDVSAHIDHLHIYYKVGSFESTKWYNGILYLLPAVFPFLVSSIRKINILGVLMLLFFVRNNFV